MNRDTGEVYEGVDRILAAMNRGEPVIEIPEEAARKISELRAALEAMLEAHHERTSLPNAEPVHAPEVEQAYRALGRDWRGER